MPNRRSRGRGNRNRIKIVDNELLNTLIIALIVIIIIAIAVFVTLNIFQEKKVAYEKERVEKQQLEIFESTNEELRSLDNYKSNSLIRISAVGDILCGKNLQEYGKPYNKIFEGISKKLKNTDFTIGTYETDVMNEKQEFAQAVKEAGINYVSLAHNHALDYGQDGLDETESYLNEIGMQTVGKNAENAEERVKIIEKKGAKIALLAYTYDNNKEGVNIFSEELAKEDLEYANQNANISIVMMHWGEVNSNEVSSKQEEQANFLVENGADIIIGAHPSVVQKMEVVKNKEGKDCFIGYSLGDFTSEFENENANLELILNLQIFVDTEGNASIYKVDYTPVYMIDYGKENAENRFKILDMKSEIANFETNKSTITQEIYDKLIRGLERLNSIIIKE